KADRPSRRPWNATTGGSGIPELLDECIEFRQIVAERELPARHRRNEPGQEVEKIRLVPGPFESLEVSVVRHHAPQRCLGLEAAQFEAPSDLGKEQAARREISKGLRPEVVFHRDLLLPRSSEVPGRNGQRLDKEIE